MLFDRIDYANWLDQQHLATRNRFQPLFEAVENAFNAVEEASIESGSVEIVILRDLSQKRLALEGSEAEKTATPDHPIGFRVVDNGIGLDDKNWTSFKTVYTPHKKQRGGKGMGRLTYLLAFKSVTIESHFQAGDKILQRRLQLKRGNYGLEDAESPVQTNGQCCGTTVTLDRLHEHLLQGCPKKVDALARHIIRHFFRRLQQTTNISFLLRDEWDGTTVDLRQLCENEFVYEQAHDKILIHQREFRINHVRCQAMLAGRHEVMLCVGGRVVKDVPLPASFTMTSKALESPQGGSFYYVAFVESEVLDMVMRQDRMSFNLEEEEDRNALPDPDASDHPSITTIINAVGQAARRFLDQVLAPLREKHSARVKEFCRRNVIYRPLLKHCFDDLQKMQVGLSDVDFEAQIATIYHRWKSDLRTRFNSMAKTVRENEAALAAYRTKYAEMLTELSDMAFHELANYVVDRRAVIDFLDDRLKSSPTGRFHDENAIHDVFFPRRSSSDDIAWDESNLWLIDERLAYQQYVASDISLRKHTTLQSLSNGRPDVAAYYDKAFDLTYAFAEGERTPSFTSVCLVEFKKPERTSYDEVENPVAQVLRYIREIRKSGTRLEDGHTFRIHESSPIHVYVVCHLVDEVLEFLKDHTFIRTPDGDGIIFHVPQQNAFVQFISFEKLIADAKKRNDVFFRKLGIDERSSQQIAARK